MSDMQLALARDDFKGADASLEQALSCDFRVRTSPLYHLIRAQVRGIHAIPTSESDVVLRVTLPFT